MVPIFFASIVVGVFICWNYTPRILKLAYTRYTIPGYQVSGVKCQPLPEILIRSSCGWSERQKPATAVQWRRWSAYSWESHKKHVFWTSRHRLNSALGRPSHFPPARPSVVIGTTAVAACCSSCSVAATNQTSILWARRWGPPACLVVSCLACGMYQVQAMLLRVVYCNSIVSVLVLDILVYNVPGTRYFARLPLLF